MPYDQAVGPSIVPSQRDNIRQRAPATGVHGSPQWLAQMIRNRGGAAALSKWASAGTGERGKDMLIPMDDIDRYALDIEKIATGTGSASERSCAVDMVIDDLMTDLAIAGEHVRLRGTPASRTEYLMELRKRLDRLRSIVDATARPAIDQAVARLH
jgi:hypothetical protein